MMMTRDLPTLRLEHKPGLILKPDETFPEEVFEVFDSKLPEWWFEFTINLYEGKLDATLSNIMADWPLLDEPDPLKAIEQLRDEQIPVLRDWLTDCMTVLTWAREQYPNRKVETNVRAG